MSLRISGVSSFWLFYGEVVFPLRFHAVCTNTFDTQTVREVSHATKWCELHEIIMCSDITNDLGLLILCFLETTDLDEFHRLRRALHMGL